MRSITIKKNRIISTVLLAMLVLAVSSVSVFAAGSVTYNGKDKGFSFGPGNSASATDVLPSFKDLMPGDSRSEDVTITNKSNKTVEISASSIGAAKNAEFIAQLNIKVDGDENKVAYPSETSNGSTSEELMYVLGKFAPGESKTVNVSLEMPITVGNEYQNAEGTLAWKFTAEEEDDEDDEDGGESEESSGGTKTGDGTNIYLWCGLGAAAVCATAAVMRRRRSRSEGR